MRSVALTVAVLSAGCMAQTPAPSATDTPAAVEHFGLEALGLIDRARALAPFVGGDLEDATAVLGEPSATVASATPGVTEHRYNIGGTTPSLVALEADAVGRVVAVSVVIEDVDAYDLIASGLDVEMGQWLGLMTDVDHGYAFWDLGERWAVIEAEDETTIVIVVSMETDEDE